MDEQQILNEIKYKISNICLNKLLRNKKLTLQEFYKADSFFRKKYKIDYLGC